MHGFFLYSPFNFLIYFFQIPEAGANKVDANKEKEGAKDDNDIDQMLKNLAG